MQNRTAQKNKQKREGTRARPGRMLLLLALVLLAVFLLSFSLRHYGVPVAQVLRILLARVFLLEQAWTPEMATVVLNIRLPRILMACLVGCSLSAADAAYQGVFQNPMASPDILGASSGAAFGAPGDVMDAALIEKLYGMRVSMVETEAGRLITPEAAGRRG